MTKDGICSLLRALEFVPCALLKKDEGCGMKGGQIIKLIKKVRLVKNADISIAF